MMSLLLGSKIFSASTKSPVGATHFGSSMETSELPITTDQEPVMKISRA
jgi:hypothetical protein